VSIALAALLTGVAAAGGEPDPLFLVDVTAVSRDQHLLAVSLQGLANRGPSGPRVFLLTHERDADWLDYCLRLAPRPVRSVDIPQLLEILRPEIDGQILYDPAQPYTVNAATTAAGLRQAVLSATDLGLPTVLDLRGRWRSAAEAERWAYESLLPECDRSKAALLPADSVALRDFAIRERMFVLSPPGSAEDGLFQTALFALPPGAAIYGEAPASLRPALSRASHFLIPASRAANLSLLSEVGAGETLHQYVGHLEPLSPRFLSLIFDCADLDFAINEMPALWDDPTRGSIPLGWAVPAALSQAAPPVARRYYADAYLSGTDQFVLGATGAGMLDLSLASAPYTFFRATARARAGLDITATLYAVAGPSDPATALPRFAGDTGMRGVFIIGAPEMAPVLLEGMPALAAPRVGSVAEAVTYLNRIPLERRFAALLLEPRHLTPADAAHIAAHVSDRFLAVPPGEMVELMRELSLPEQPGPAALQIASVDYPQTVDPSLPTPVTARIDAPRGLLSAAVIYRRADRTLAFSEPMALSRGVYSALIPPLRPGGSIELGIRARDLAGRSAWSPTWSLDVPRDDGDDDGLSDAEESFLLTREDTPDTDGDGLLDGADIRPLRADRTMVTYLGPIRPPSDLPYLPEPGGSRADRRGRSLEAGQTCMYWLPLALLPPGAPAVVALDARGPGTLSVSADPTAVGREYSGEFDGLWHSDAIPAEAERGGVLARLSCPEDAGRPLLIRAISVISPPGAPSVDRITWYPAYPGPLQAIFVSAVAYGPEGVAGVDITYRVNEGGTVSFPMQPVAGSYRYEARIPPLENRDRLEWWITARGPDESRAVTSPNFLAIGGRAREVVPLLARRDFLGEWTGALDWDGASRQADSPGLRDSAHVNLTGATYTVWVLAGGRGRGIDVYVKDRKVGSIDPRRPDGWQRIGRVRLDAGRHEVHLVSQPGDGDLEGAAPRYASVILTPDSTLALPAGRIFDMHNSITLLFPPAGHVMSGRVELLATGAGNLTAAEFSLDGETLRRVSGPPFRYSLNSARLPQGEHVLRVEAVDRAGPTGLGVEVPVTIADAPSP
jgi:hypothetical protein